MFFSKCSDYDTWRNLYQKTIYETYKSKIGKDIYTKMGFVSLANRYNYVIEK